MSRETPDHFLGLDGAVTINTRDFAMAQQVVRDVSGALAMGAIHGEAGLGKTFAVEHALRSLKLEAYTVKFPGRATMRLVTRKLLEALTGVNHEGERFALTDDLIDILSHRPRTIVIDEAQRLNAECFEHLRHLHDDERTRFALLLVGGNGCWAVLSKHAMLRSRIFRNRRFARLTLEEVLEVLPAFHPAYEAADPEVLALVDDVFAHGIFRNWASFTLTALQVCADVGTEHIDERVARGALALLGGDERG